MNARLALAAASLVLLSACQDVGLSGPRPLLPLVTVQRVAVDTSDVGAISLDVRLSTAATVDVRYWPTGGGDTLEVTDAEPADGGKLLLPRLRPGVEYKYDVVARNADGEAGSRVDGVLRAAGLPAIVRGRSAIRGRSNCSSTRLTAWRAASGRSCRLR